MTSRFLKQLDAVIDLKQQLREHHSECVCCPHQAPSSVGSHGGCICALQRLGTSSILIPLAQAYAFFSIPFWPRRFERTLILCCDQPGSASSNALCFQLQALKKT